MNIDEVRLKTSKSNKILELAERYAKEAQSLSSGDDKRKWLEQEAARLIAEARDLTTQAKEQAATYR